MFLRDETSQLMAGFTVNTLLYGEYPDLARRCLTGLLSADPGFVRGVRIGLNAVCRTTRLMVREFAAKLSADIPVLVYDAGETNRLKYPMMRKMFFDPEHPVITTHLMWLDDDSAVNGGKAWWSRAMEMAGTADLLGAPYRLKALPQQLQAIRNQPWYGGKDFLPDHHFKFVTGGFWIVKTRIVQKWNYPFHDIIHNGGDTLLGELCRQQGYTIGKFTDDVLVNADENGNMSKALRRGKSQKPTWHDYPAGGGVLMYHDFTIEAHDPRVPAAAAVAKTNTSPGFPELEGF